jgi:hypothetical protein
MTRLREQCSCQLAYACVLQGGIAATPAVVTNVVLCTLLPAGGTALKSRSSSAGMHSVLVLLQASLAFHFSNGNEMHSHIALLPLHVDGTLPTTASLACIIVTCLLCQMVTNAGSRSSC